MYNPSRSYFKANLRLFEMNSFRLFFLQNDAKFLITGSKLPSS